MEKIYDEIEQTIGKKPCPNCFFALVKSKRINWLGELQYECAVCDATFVFTDTSIIKKPRVNSTFDK